MLIAICKKLGFVYAKICKKLGFFDYNLHLSRKADNKSCFPLSSFSEVDNTENISPFTFTEADSLARANFGVGQGFCLLARPWRIGHSREWRYIVWPSNGIPHHKLHLFATISERPFHPPSKKMLEYRQKTHIPLTLFWIVRGICGSLFSRLILYL